VNQVIWGDCLQVIWTLPKARMIFADPPDNLNLKYDGYKDQRENYYPWLSVIVRSALCRAPILWLSHYYRHTPLLLAGLDEKVLLTQEVRLFLWRFTFGQHRQSDCGNGYRPILRIAPLEMQWNTDAIRVPSARALAGDRRADPRGRVPDDVFEFSRVCGTFRERRKWIPCQHPEALIERMLRMSCRPGDIVVDLFAGSGVVNRVAPKLGLHCYSIDLSRLYCERIAQETGAVLVEHPCAIRATDL
jgi:site-specific DNA-methyltransferase (adenine-specific)